jgi:hypothetical protein
MKTCARCHDESLDHLGERCVRVRMIPLSNSQRCSILRPIKDLDAVLSGCIHVSNCGNLVGVKVDSLLSCKLRIGPWRVCRVARANLEEPLAESACCCETLATILQSGIEVSATLTHKDRWHRVSQKDAQDKLNLLEGGPAILALMRRNLNAILVKVCNQRDERRSSMTGGDASWRTN